MKKRLFIILFVCSLLCTSFNVVNATSINTVKYNNQTYYTTYSAAGTATRNKLKARDTSFKINIRVLKNTEDQTAVNKMLKEATKYTGVATEGDYILINVKDYSWKSSWNKSGKYKYLSVTYTFKYQTTSAQENKVNTKVTTILKQLNISGKSDYAKAKAIHDYICKNTVYTSGASNQYSAYGCLIDGKCVCQGYALAFYRLGEAAGLKVRYIRGTINNGKTKHGWNIVEIGNTYYNVDCTWDDDTSFTSGYSTQFFLKGSYTFESHHARNSEYTTNTFLKAYPVSTSDYSTSYSESCKALKYATFTMKQEKIEYTGETITPSFYAKDASGNTLTFDSDYTASYTPQTEPGVYTIQFTRNDTTVSMHYVIVPKAVTNLKVYISKYRNVKAKWSASTGASGYRIFYRKAGTSNWSTKDTTDTFIVLEDMDPATKYFVQVVPYVTSSSNQKFLNTNDLVTSSVYTLKKLDAPTVTKSSSTQVKVSWTNIEGESGYQISQSTNKTDKNVVSTIESTTATSKVITATKNKTYYYKVRAYKKVGSATVYTPWSNIVTYTLK